MDITLDCERPVLSTGGAGRVGVRKRYNASANVIKNLWIVKPRFCLLGWGNPQTGRRCSDWPDTCTTDFEYSQRQSWYKVYLVNRLSLCSLAFSPITREYSFWTVKCPVSAFLGRAAPQCHSTKCRTIISRRSFLNPHLATTRKPQTCRPWLTAQLCPVSAFLGGATPQ